MELFGRPRCVAILIIIIIIIKIIGFTSDLLLLRVLTLDEQRKTFEISVRAKRNYFAL